VTYRGGDVVHLPISTLPEFLEQEVTYLETTAEQPSLDILDSHDERLSHSDLIRSILRTSVHLQSVVELISLLRCEPLDRLGSIGDDECEDDAKSDS
jgi:hypothetical protein